MAEKELNILDSDNKSDDHGRGGKGEKRKRQSPSSDLGDDQNPPSKTRKIVPAEKTVYQDLLDLNQELLLRNFERFECPICFDAFDVGEGVTLKECLHSACMECLAGAVAHCEDPLVKCPYLDGDYACDGFLQESEVKELVSPEMFGRYLGRSVSLAECQDQDSFHCRTPDCAGWWLREGEGKLYICPVCDQENCVVCLALHGGRTCEQWREERSAATAEATESQAYLERALRDRRAMLCPKCKAVITKRGGCDAVTCIKCKTHICWATRGPRWGPAGRGDTSGGCGCTFWKPCHPKCFHC